MDRILASLDERRLLLDETSKSKIVALTAEVHKADLGLGSEQMELFRKEVRCIVHLAWPVNFNIGLSSFESHLEGLRNLLSLSMSVRRPEPARLFFASSISTAESTPGPALIPDGPINDFGQALAMGYAQSKLVAEHIVLNAACSGARAYVLRIGQIVGDLEHGVWNDSEFVPSIIRSALSLGVLPDLPDQCSWIPVDTLATAILELDETVKATGNQDGNVGRHAFYNMVNPREFQWKELLEQLRDAGLKFDTIGVEDWIRRLQEVAGKDDGVEEVRNPAVKLIHHFEQRYLSNKSSLTGNIRFDTKAVQRDSEVLRSPPDIIGEGYVQKFVATWMKKWLPAMGVHANAP
jgi:thioester reductase-like protein